MDSRRDMKQGPADASETKATARAKAPYHPPSVQQLDMGLGTNVKQFGGSEVTTPGYRGGPRVS